METQYSLTENGQLQVIVQEEPTVYQYDLNSLLEKETQLVVELEKTRALIAKFEEIKPEESEKPEPINIEE